MKKFKIIEEGRILSKEELNQLEGGCAHIGCNYYSNCYDFVWTTCKPNAAYGYNFYQNCGNGMSNYASCNSNTHSIIVRPRP